MATLQERLARMRADAGLQTGTSLTSRLERMRADAQQAAAGNTASPGAASSAGAVTTQVEEPAAPDVRQLKTRADELNRELLEISRAQASGLGDQAALTRSRAEKEAELQKTQSDLKARGDGGYSLGKGLAGTVVKGLEQAGYGLAQTAAFLEDAVLTPIELLTGQKPGDLSDNGFFNQLARLGKEEVEGWENYYAGNTARGGKAAQLLDEYGTATVAAVPNAVLALLSGGGSAAAQTTEGVAKLANAALSPGVSSTVANAIGSMAKNPMFWSSFAQVAGSGYEQALADGASRDKAALYAVGNGILNAAVEIGGGIETLPEVMQGGKGPFKAWVEGMLDEGKEEVVQGIIERGLQNVIYGKDNPVFSLSDENAILNPGTSMKEFAGGAVVGGILGGAELGVNSAVNRAANKALEQTREQGRVFTPAQAAEGQDGAPVAADGQKNSAGEINNAETASDTRAAQTGAFDSVAVSAPEGPTDAAHNADNIGPVLNARNAPPSSPSINTIAQAAAVGNTKNEPMPILSAAELEEERARRAAGNINERTGINEQGAEAGSGPAAGTEGTDLSDGGAGRPAGQRTGERTVRVPEEVRTKGGGRAQREVALRRAQAAQDAAIPLTSAAAVGLRNGTEAETVMVLPEADWDEEIRQASAWACDRGVREVKALLGQVEVAMSGPDGAYTGRVLGQYDPDTGTLYARADSVEQSFSETVEHEVAHLLAGEGTVEAFRDAVMSRYKQAGWGTVYDAYERAYRGVTNDYEGMTARERSLYVWGDILADAWSDKNKFGVAASVYGAEADAALEGRTAGANAGARQSIEYDADNRAFVTVDEDILDGVPQSQWVRTVKDNLRKKFPNGVTVGNSQIHINATTRNELTSSRNTQSYRARDTQTYGDKLRATNNLDELLAASRDYVNEAPLHPRTDNFTDFGRGTVQMRIGDRDYSADVVVGYTSGGRMVMYDIVNMQPSAILSKKTPGAEFTAQPRTAGRTVDSSIADKRNAAPATGTDSIRRGGEKSNPQNQGPVDFYDLVKDGPRYSVEDSARTEAERERDDRMEQVLFRHVTPLQEDAGAMEDGGRTHGAAAATETGEASAGADIPDLFRPEDMSDEQYNALNRRYREHKARMAQMDENTREQIMGRGSRSGFHGTDALEKLGVRVEGSVGIYSNVESLLANERAAREVKKQTRAAERRLGPTDKEKSFAHGLAEGVYDAADIPDTVDRDKVYELADYYMAEGTFSERPLAHQRRYIKELLGDQMRELFKDGEQVRPSGSLVLNRRTPERNMLHIFGDTQGKAINEFIFDPVAANEAERYRWMTGMFDRVRSFEDSKGRKRELNRTERFLAQLALEGKDETALLAGVEHTEAVRQAAEEIGRGASVDKAAKKHGLDAQGAAAAAVLAKWGKAQNALKAGKADAAKVENAVKAYRVLYNDLYDAINDFLAAHGYQPIGFIKDYAPHFQSQDSMALLEKALKSMGVGADAGKLPASIAGQTADFKPGKRWDPHFLTRLGDSTEYDAAKGFEQYIEYISDIFYHTDDIAKVREASNYFRQTYSPEDIRDSMDWAAALRYGTADEKRTFLREHKVVEKAGALSDGDVDRLMDEYVEKLLKDTQSTSKFSDLVMWLDNYANILAGKQSSADRGWEADFGRGSLNIGRRLMGIFGRAQVAGNISSALNQTAQLPQIAAEVGPVRCAHAVADVMAGRLRKASWIQESDFLTGKDGVDFLVTDPAEMVVGALFKPAELVDSLTSAVAVRGKYLQEIKAGRTHQEAMKAADDFAKSVMGSRMKGSKPLGFHAKNPLAQAVNMFQVEALNSWEHISQDLPRDFRTIARERGTKDAALALAGVIVKSLLGAFILNRLAEALYGGTPAPMDLIGISCNFIASGEGLTTNKWLRKVIDDGAEKLGWGRVFDTDGDEGFDEFDLKAAAEDTAYNVMNDVPYVRNLAGVLGLGDETLPMPDLYGKGKALGEAVLDDGLLSADAGKAALDLLAQVAPGGRQLSKTLQGAEIAGRGGRYKGSGDNERLQYPIDEGWGDALLALLFGGNGLEEQRAFYAAGGKGLSAKETGTYRTLTENGVGRKDAYNAIKDMAGLEPMEGHAGVTDQQKALSVAGLGLSQQATDAAVGSLLSGDQLSDYEAARRAGLDPETYLTWKLQIAVMQSIDKDGDGKADITRQEQVVDAIDKLPITRAQKDALYLTEYAESGLAKNKIW